MPTSKSGPFSFPATPDVSEDSRLWVGSNIGGYNSPHASECKMEVLEGGCRFVCPITRPPPYKRANSGRDLVHLESISWHPIEPLKSRVGPGLPRPADLWTPKLDDTGTMFTTGSTAELKRHGVYLEATWPAAGSNGGYS